MTLSQALRKENYMKPIRGTEELAFSEQSLIILIKQIFNDFESDKPSKRRVRTNIVVTKGEIPSFRSYMDVKSWLEVNNTNKSGKPLAFKFEEETVKISSFGKPYYHDKDSMPDLTFDDCGRFYKTLYNFKFMLEDALKG